jgi:hypothetical protein
MATKIHDKNCENSVQVGLQINLSEAALQNLKIIRCFFKIIHIYKFLANILASFMSSYFWQIFWQIFIRELFVKIS